MEPVVDTGETREVLMKVSELIEKLQALPQDMQVIAISTDDVQFDPADIFVGSFDVDENLRRVEELVDEAKREEENPEELAYRLEEIESSKTVVIGLW